MLMSKKILTVILLFILLLAGCSGGMSDESKSGSDMGAKTESMDNSESNDVSFSEGEEDSAVENNESDDGKAKSNAADIAMERMVIYNAEMNLKVKNFEKARNALEQKAKSYKGYIVNSSSNRYDGEQQSGTMTFRIPQEHFQAFLNDAEGLSVQVYNRQVSGEDVTEEYVDLESRLKSKRAVEARLLEFMKQAQKTEDLLKISSDLANVQEEIEQIAGRKKFLENQSALSTVTISLEENEVPVPKIDNENLNTWQKIKKQFADNINILLSAGSGIMVFLIGNLPILLIVGIIVSAIIFFVKKYTRRSENNNIDSNS
jgi:major membrane immunogen (membrane-anchored lipoprotein)